MQDALGCIHLTSNTWVNGESSPLSVSHFPRAKLWVFRNTWGRGWLIPPFIQMFSIA